MSALRRDRGGLPIAAHLGLLVALAFASAFVVMIAVIIFLPPRPPDVVRGDQILEQFAAGFADARAQGRAPPNSDVTWRIVAAAPRERSTPGTLPLRTDLAERLQLEPANVRVAARTARSDVFVFRVREVERHMHMQHEMRLRHGEAGDDVEARIEEEVAAIEKARRESGEAGRRVETRVVTVPRPPNVSELPDVLEPPTPPGVPLFAPAPPGVLLLSGFEIAAQMADGRWLVMRQGRNWAELGWIGRAALVTGATLALLLLLALFFARRLGQPIRSFADAVQAVGVDPQSEPVREEGARELRGAARAVNTMQARLRALIADRTKTLAAVAHDMRTPLMRLRLQAENVPAEQREKMAKEIEEVEALVASFIAFARDDPAEEAARPARSCSAAAKHRRRPSRSRSGRAL